MPFIPYLITLVRISSTIVNRRYESGHPCLVPDLRGKPCNLLPSRMVLAMCVSYIAFVILEYVPSIYNLLGFYHEWMSNFVKSLFWIRCSCNLLRWYITLTFFVYMELFLYRRDTNSLFMVYDPFNMLLSLVC